MSNDTVHDTTGPVLDPALPRWRRRYFHQPDVGPGRRAFTARGASSGRAVRSSLGQRWATARETETARRAGKAWF